MTVDFRHRFVPGSATTSPGLDAQTIVDRDTLNRLLRHPRTRGVHVASIAVPRRERQCHNHKFPLTMSWGKGETLSRTRDRRTWAGPKPPK